MREKHQQSAILAQERGLAARFNPGAKAPTGS